MNQIGRLLLILTWFLFVLTDECLAALCKHYTSHDWQIFDIDCLQRESAAVRMCQQACL